MRWYGDALDISLPRKQATASGDIVAFPWSDFVDNRVLRGQPRSYYDVYADTFEYLRAHEPMGLIHVGFHSHFGGRPLMTAMFDKLLEISVRAAGRAFSRPQRDRAVGAGARRSRVQLRQPVLRLGRMDGGGDQPQT